MKSLVLLTAILLAVVVVKAAPQPRKFKTTADRVSGHGYPAEEHTVQTSDGYILTLFRIPYSPKLKNQNVRNKSVVFLQHGLLSSSDSWILNGPNDALAFLLADQGYDVWMGNSRGNTYAKKHATKTPLLPPFWDFSWHEIGIYDLTAMIDYVLYLTEEDSLHYVGHSQGTTAYMVMLSSVRRYNDKIKTSHMLAPVGYMENMKSPLALVCGPLLGHPTLLSDLIGSNEFLPSTKLFSLLGSAACSDKSIFQPICGNILFLIAGWDSKQLNYTLLPDVMETHPAGSSTSQLIHYLQEYESGYFREFDHGRIANKKYYNQRTPPLYNTHFVSQKPAIQFYYSDNDYFAAVEDVERMANEMGYNVELNHVPFPDFNHLDFLWALNVKSIVYDGVIDHINDYEKSK